jgi:hypothetical protein
MDIPKTVPTAAAMSSDQVATLTALLDGLIPGDARRWPMFSAAVPVEKFTADLGSSDRQALEATAATMTDLSDAAINAAIKAWEQAKPVSFAAVLSTMERAYYTAPAVIEVVTMLANAGPREPKQQFDPALITQVVATGAGKRRL